MSRYPDWVNQYKKKGTVVKKVGDSYYLYSNTSKYVKGKKYPQPVQHFIGVITHDGVIESHKQKVSLTDIEVYEYAFSYALVQLCPNSWKKSLKDDWNDVLCAIVALYSPRSFLVHQNPDYHRNIQHHNLKVQESHLEEQMGLKIKDLEPLKEIFALKIDGKIVISKIGFDQKQLIEQLGITIGGEKG